MVNVLDYGLEVSKSELQSWSYVHFQIITPGKGINLLIPQAMDQIGSLLFLFKYGFGIK